MEGTMDGSTAVAGATLSKALDTQTFGASLITKTLDKMNANTSSLNPQVNSDYAFQKDVLSAAYADKGIGTRLNTVA